MPPPGRANGIYLGGGADGPLKNEGLSALDVSSESLPTDATCAAGWRSQHNVLQRYAGGGTQTSSGQEPP